MQLEDMILISGLGGQFCPLLAVLCASGNTTASLWHMK
jgi:hypothetical protein